MKTVGIRSGNRIYEKQTDEILNRAFLENTEICDLLRKRAGTSGAGTAEAVDPQHPHKCDKGTIDLRVDFDGLPLLVENKIQAPWSQTSEGIAQPERYERSAEALGGKSVLVAPQAYISKVPEARGFDICLEYEEVARLLTGEERYIVEEAARQALTPTMNPDEIVTAFFLNFEALVKTIAPVLVMNTRYIRNEGSFTAHFNPRKTLTEHPGVQVPSIFLQFRQGNVKLLFEDWAPAIASIRAIGGLEGTGYSLERIPGGNTVGVVAPSPQIDPHESFEDQRQSCVAAIRATEQLCAWWESSAPILQGWEAAAQRI